MKRPTRKDLATWRPISQEEEVRTRWSSSQRSWLLERRWKEQEMPSEKLDLSRWAGATRISLAELRAVNKGFPLQGVFADDDGWWATEIECAACQGFVWRLPLRVSRSWGLRLQWETECARFMAGRAANSFELRVCPGCKEKEIESSEDPSACWFSVRHQDWCVRLALLPEEWIVVTLGLPSWASRADVLREVDRIVARKKPFDWEENS